MPAARRSIAMVAFALLTLVPTVFAVGGEGLTARLEEVLRGHGLGAAQVSALVVRLSDGAVLFQRSPDSALAPASNMKVLTALAALAEFGPAHRFTTTVYADAAPDATGSVSVLAVRGGGDPALTVEEWWRLAADLRRGGLRAVRDGLVLDDSAFDRVHWHPGWKGVAERAYHSPVGALNANYGTFAIEVEAGRAPGNAVRIAIDPALSYLALDNRARTGPADGRSALQIERQPERDGERIVVSGTVPARQPAEVYYRSVSDPAAYAGAVLRMQLEANGIRVTGPTRTGRVPDGWHEVLTFRGKPLAEILRLMMKYSNNGIAESLVKGMGAHLSGGPGTWENGIEASRQRLVALGLRPDTARLVDGSGLAHENRVPARLLVQALQIARASFTFGPEFVSSLPIAATDGTLERRAKDAAGAVRAKSGLLSDAIGLSGYARMRDGTETAFSVLVNDFRHGAADAMAMLDTFVAEIVSHDGASPGDRP
jgi:D-alanyl-D-alanine carboxypeptidase/D-alanyl-D-alanine-endopeptidase (penicillin-binding protein 4)